MLKKLFIYLFIFITILFGFSINFLEDFEKNKESILVKNELKTKTTILFLQENLKSYMLNKDEELLNKVSSVYSSDFNSILILKNSFLIKEEDLVLASQELDKNLLWELSNLQIDSNLGEISLFTQSDDLQKELLTIEGSIPNELNKDLTPSLDIYNFIPNKKFKNLSSLVISFDATNQFDQTIKSSALVNFDKTISSFKNSSKENYVPFWFKNIIPIYFNEDLLSVNNSLQDNIVFYLDTNIEKIYFELYDSSKTIFLNYLFIFIAVCFVIILLSYIFSFIRKKLS